MGWKRIKSEELGISHCMVQVRDNEVKFNRGDGNIQKYDQ